LARTAVAIAALYVLFAAFSTSVNIGSQMLSMWLYTGVHAVEVSMLVGTAAGLPLRYLLEKRYVFAFTAKTVAHDGQRFVLYSFMGVFTTALFWSVEYAFHLIFAIEALRYAGGIIGLALGFYVKYQLDKKYVFVGGSRPAAA
jgi:putative flippase GtrA